jgi:outer membrane protein assembly factor BamB
VVDVPQGVLRAVDAATQAVAWTFKGDGWLSTVPLVVGGQVVIGSNQGKVFGLDETSGAVLWSDDVGAPLESESTRSGGSYFTAFAAAGGVLVVPAGNSVIGYAHR